MSDAQPALFELPPREVQAVAPSREHAELAAKLPPRLRLGTMSWSYPGWAGVIYADGASPKVLSDVGLTAYVKHPLLRAVELDRTYYEPMSPAALAALAAQTPRDFVFMAKAHEECTIHTFPSHPRYGKRRGERNGRYLDAAYASESVIAPLAEGLGDKLGAVLLPFPPQDVFESPDAFAERLHRFLTRLPKGITYAVELRNVELFTPRYLAALAEAGAVHVHNIWPGMPPLLKQVMRVPPEARRPLIVRWLMRPGDSYDDAEARCAPFSRIVDEDLAQRAAVAHLARKAAAHDVPTLVFIDNKAEGCAPETAVRLARAITA